MKLAEKMRMPGDQITGPIVRCARPVDRVAGRVEGSNYAGRLSQGQCRPWRDLDRRSTRGEPNDPPVDEQPTSRQQGLYHPANEHDACGVSFVAQMDGTAQPPARRAGHRLAVQPRTPRRHRRRDRTPATAPASSSRSPIAFFRAVVDFELPAAGAYAVGLAFLPADPGAADEAADAVAKIIDSEGLTVLGWRDVPVDPIGADIGQSALGGDAGVPAAVRRSSPRRPRLGGSSSTAGCSSPASAIEHELLDDGGDPLVYFPSLSSRTLVYKGMLTTPQLGAVLPRPDRRPRRVGHRPGALAGSPPTRSRRGRWPTRTGSSPTTARSTRCRATRTGCGPARRCWPRRCSEPATVPTEDLSRSARPGRPTRPASTRRSNCCTSAATACRTPC